MNTFSSFRKIICLGSCLLMGGCAAYPAGYPHYSGGGGRPYAAPSGYGAYNYGAPPVYVQPSRGYDQRDYGGYRRHEHEEHERREHHDHD